MADGQIPGTPGPGKFKKITGKLTLLFGLSALILLLAVLAQGAMGRIIHHPLFEKHDARLMLGTIGTMMIFISLAGYVSKKLHPAFSGRLRDWLSIHERYAIMGVLLIFIHTGMRFRAMEPAITFGLLAVCLISGMVGRYVYMTARRNLDYRREKLLAAGVAPELVDEALAFETAAANTLSGWRFYHRALTLLLGVFLAFHVVSSLYYGG